MVEHDTSVPQRPILLLAFANDGRAGRYLPSLGAEIGALRQVLSKAAEQGLCELMVRESTTREELLEIFSDARYRERIALVHFAGHATADDLLLEGEPTPVAAHAGGLVQLLCALKSLKVVFLNGCSTLSYARCLVEAGIPAAISTERPVSDELAQRFAADFYRALGEGSEVAEAFEYALASATCFCGVGDSGSRRDLTAPCCETLPDPEWRFIVAGSGEDARRWSLPTAAHDPLFGIPAPARDGLPQEPFRGLRRFTDRHAGIFFGRGDLIRSLYEDVANPGLPHALVVYGPSGAGKSSLLEAGLLPRLCSTFDVHLLRLERGRDPEPELLEALDANDRASVAEAWLARERDVGRPLVLCVDQLESLIIGPSGDAELSRFMATLAPLLAGDETRLKGKLILGLRKEWFPELRDALQRHTIQWQDHYVKPLDHRGVMEVILGPTRTGTLRARYGIEVEPGLARRIADDLLIDPDSAIAPTLQILLTRMWDEAVADVVDDAGRTRRRFSSALYDRLRREGLALGDFVHRQLVAIGTRYPEALASGLVHDLLHYHTTSRGTSASHPLAATFVRYSERKELVSEIVVHCETLYLLQRVVGGVEQRASTRLAHDTLAPIIREIYERSQAPGQVAARVLAARVRTADDRRSPPPLDAFDLELVEAGRAGMRTWTDGEHRLVRRSQGHHARAAWARVLRAMVVVGSVTFGLQFLFWNLEENRDRNARALADFTSQDRRWPIGPKVVAPVTPTVTFEHPRDAHDSGESAAAPRSDRETLDEQSTVPAGGELEPNPIIPRTGPAAASSRCGLKTWSTGLSSAIGSVAISPDGGLVALGMRSAQRVFVFDPTVEPPSREELKLEAHASRLAWSPDGRRLIVGEASREGHGFAELFGRGQKGSFRDPIECDGHHNRVDVAVFSSNGEHLITGDHGGLVILRDGESCERLDQILLEGRVYDAAELSDNRWAFGGAGGQTVVWPIEGSNLPSDLASVGRAAVHSVVLSPGGRSLLTTGDRIYLRDSRQGKVLDKYVDREVVQWATWLGMRSVVIARTRTRVLRWQWADGQLGPPRELHAIDDATIAVAAGSDDVFVGERAGRVYWWRFRDGDLELHDELRLLDGPIESLATHPTGAYIVAGGDRGRARVLALGERNRPCQDLVDDNHGLP